GAAEQACADLRWLGLDWDEGPVVQSTRLPLYQEALVKLKEREFVYPCICTRRDVELAASAPHLEHEGPVYPGTCRVKRALDAEMLQGQPFAWRFRITSESPTYEDGLLGPTSVDLKDSGGDFVVWKSDDTTAYQLAVVVDDSDQKITEVIRGDD